MEKNKIKFEENIDFVASHYSGEVFSDEQKREDYCQITGKRLLPIYFTKRRSAAAVAVSVALVAIASSIAVYYSFVDKSPEEIDKRPVEQVESAVLPEQPDYAVVEFDDAPLAAVVSEIENLYGVQIEGVPEKEMRLTIHYEGDVQDLVETINDLLDINLEITAEK